MFAETREEIGHFTERSKTLEMLNERLRVLIRTVEVFKEHDTNVHVSIGLYCCDPAGRVPSSTHRLDSYKFSEVPVTWHVTYMYT